MHASSTKPTGSLTMGTMRHDHRSDGVGIAQTIAFYLERGVLYTVRSTLSMVISTLLILLSREVLRYSLSKY